MLSFYIFKDYVERAHNVQNYLLSLHLLTNLFHTDCAVYSRAHGAPHTYTHTHTNQRLQHFCGPGGCVRIVVRRGSCVGWNFRIRLHGRLQRRVCVCVCGEYYAIRAFALVRSCLHVCPRPPRLACVHTLRAQTLSHY